MHAVMHWLQKVYWGSSGAGGLETKPWSCYTCYRKAVNWDSKRP